MISKLICFLFLVTLIDLKAATLIKNQPPSDSFSFAPLFSERMVLQRDKKVVVWGRATSGKAVTVKIQDQVVTTLARNGVWKITLEPMTAGGPFQLTAECEGKVISIKEIMIGDVFIGGGQSNMQMGFIGTEGAKGLLSSVSNSKIRLCTIPHKIHDNDGVDERPEWNECTPQSVSSFSAVLYFFGAHLQKNIDVPIGLVNCSYGNTLAECWISKEALLSRPETSPILQSYDNFLSTKYLQLKEQDDKYLFDLSAYNQAEAIGKKLKKPKAVYGGPLSHRRPSGMYDYMVSNYIGAFTFKGAFWYQAEANAREERGWQFRYVLADLVECWRKTFDDETLPYIFVQPPAFQDSMISRPAWADTRESILVAADTIANTSMVVAIDYPGLDPKNIHPERKSPIGYRLSLLARKNIYGESDLIAEGPKVQEVKIINDRIFLTFKNVGTGLKLSNESGVAFTICGAEGDFQPAKAELVNGGIEISSPNVTKPVAVRYGWFNYFVPTLYNQEGLAASPFRTDTFPLESEHNLTIKGSSSEN